MFQFQFLRRKKDLRYRHPFDPKVRCIACNRRVRRSAAVVAREIPTLWPNGDLASVRTEHVCKGDCSYR